MKFTKKIKHSITLKKQKKSKLKKSKQNKSIISNQHFTKKNNNQELNIYKLKKIYNDIIINKKQLNIKNYLIEFILNYYLLLKKYRDVFLITCSKNGITMKTIKEYFLDKYNIHYIIKSNIAFTRIIVYNPNRFNIKQLNTSFGKEFANQLGNFYVCAKNKGHYGIKSKYRINISITKPNSNIKVENNKIITNEENIGNKDNKFIFNNIEIYGQMCIPSFINSENITKLKTISKDISIILKKFDKKLITELKFVSFKRFLGLVPYKIINDEKIIYT